MNDQVSNPKIKPAKDVEPVKLVPRTTTATRIYVSNRWHRRDGNMHGKPPYFLDNGSGLLVRP